MNTASFWLMSKGGVIDAVCVDICGPNGELINHHADHGQMSYCAAASSYDDGLAKAVAYAARYGVREQEVYYDSDSTETYEA